MANTTASDGTTYNLDTSACGDFPECHDESRPCGCPDRPPAR